MKTVEIIIECLRSALLGEAFDRARAAYLTEEELVAVYKESKRHDISHIIGAVLGENKVTEPFKKLKLAFEDQQMLAVFRYENIKYETDRICKALNGEGIPFVRLKGSVIRELYPEPWMRTSCDIDIFIKKEDIDRARELLINRFSYEYTGVHTDHDISLYSASGVHVELHHSLEGKSDSVNKLLCDAWNRAISISEGGSEHAFDNEFAFFYFIAHAMTHFLIGGCGIRTLADIALMREKMTLDEEKLSVLFSECGLERFARGVIALSEYWFSDGEKTELVASLEDFVVSGGVYGTVTSNVAVKQSKEGGKSGYLRSRIFASYDALKERYPSLNSHAMVPVYQVRRWVDMARGGRLKRSLRELRISSEIDGEKMQRLSDLMSDLGLDK